MAADYDVLVAGGGPAGSAAAAAARLAGLRVALLDDCDEQRWKPGESLPGAVLRTLRRLRITGPEQLLEPDERERCTANVSAWGSERWTYQDALVNPEGGGWHVLRHRFDLALRRHAAQLGVEHLRGRVTGSSSGEAGQRLLAVRLGSSGQAAQLSARFVVDATGRRALLARQLGVRRQRLSRQSALVGWLRQTAGDIERTTRSRSVPDGWWYTARLPQGARVVAFHALPAAIAPLSKSPELFAERCSQAGLLPRPISAGDWLLPPRASDASVRLGEQVAGAGWIAAGDAALSFDPLSSQGVLFALYSGIRAAEAIVSCLQQPEHGARWLDEYAARVRSVASANQRTRRLLYGSELRYSQEEYWRQQRASCGL